MTCDVLVLGAGSAGLAAAVTAARRGASVILVERHGFAGGMGTASLVHTFCGLYLPGEGPAVVANPGFPAEMEERMRRATGSGPVRMGRVWVLPQHPVEFVRIADGLLAEAGVRVLYHGEAVRAEADADGWRVEIAGRGGIFSARAKVVVDASGDAVFAALAGAGTATTDPAGLQRPAYVFAVQGVFEGEAGLVLAGRIVEGVRKGVLSKESLGLHFRSSGRRGEIFGTIDLSGTEEGRGYDPLDAACLSSLEIAGRGIASAAIDFLKREAQGWAGAYVSQWPVRAGVRESRRWIGKQVLTAEEILSGARHADDIALATWPLELRETNRGPKLRYPENDAAAGIPLGCLIPADLERVFVAGRCISCDHGAQASIRVMGTCFATGEAAGIQAAAL
jgi:glycine/D-amino acid oxidase-like deaminating enzyme